MFSARLLHSYPREVFCMICGLQEGEKRLRAIYHTPKVVKVTNPKKEPWYKTGQLKNGKIRVKKRTDVYLFHEEPCWDRLLEHLGPDQLNPSLFEALECLPLPRGYGFTSCSSLPGRIGLEIWPGNEYHEQHCSFILPGQFPLPRLEELMRFAKDPPKSYSTTTQRTVHHPRDKFAQLPFEIIEIIADMLPTQDALNLRYVTRAALPLFTSSTFWKTRFAIIGERGFLLPVIREFTTTGRGHDIDWRLLYHCTAKLNCSDWFEIEIRAWETLRWLRDTASAIRSGRTRPSDFRGSPALQHYHNTTRRNTFMQSVKITSSLCQIAISAAQEAGEVNITGMEFIFNDGQPNAILGYATPGAKQTTREDYRDEEDPLDAHPTWPYPGIRVMMDVVGLRGIAYYKDANGIHGVSIYHDGENFDEIGEFEPFCVGIPIDEDYPMQTRYSVSLDKVEQVIAVVDNRKMINLGISGTKTKRTEYTDDEWKDLAKSYKRGGYMGDYLDFGGLSQTS